MEKSDVTQFADIVDELLRWIGGSFWFWMVMDSFKPGLVSFYWDLSVHGGVVVMLIIVSVLINQSSTVSKTSSL